MVLGLEPRTIPKKHAYAAALSIIKNHRATMTVRVKEWKDSK